MTVKLKTEYLHPEEGIWVAYPWWLNFWAEPSHNIERELTKYNARLELGHIPPIPRSDQLVFESEEDAIYFVLRWS